MSDLPSLPADRSAPLSVGDVDLDAIRARHAATTGGTWRVVRSCFGEPYPSAHFGFVIENGDQAISYAAFTQQDTRTSGIIRPEDAAFMAESHQDVPTLLGLLEQRDARIAELEAQNEAAYTENDLLRRDDVYDILDAIKPEGGWPANATNARFSAPWCSLEAVQQARHKIATMPRAALSPDTQEVPRGSE